MMSGVLFARLDDHQINYEIAHNLISFGSTKVIGGSARRPTRPRTNLFPILFISPNQ